MATLGNIIGLIRSDIDRGSDLDWRIRQAIADAVVNYESTRLGFNQKRATATLPAGFEFIALPPDWIDVDHLRLDGSDFRDPLEEVTYDWIDDHQRSDSVIGEPRKFAIQNRELRLYPTPDQEYTLLMNYHFKLTDVSASASDAVSNAWTNEAELLVRRWAQRDVLLNYIGGPDAQGAAAPLTPLIEQSLKQLKDRAAREQGTGRVRAWL